MLPWVFFNALSPELQTAMRKEKYSLPSPMVLESKSSQIKAMTICRDLSRTCYSSIIDMHLHIESVMGRNGSTLNHTRVGDDVGREEESRNWDEEDRHPEARGDKYRGKAIAERTMKQGQYNADTPVDFTQIFKVVGGTKFPCHPRDDHL